MTYPAELVEETKNFWKYKITEPCLGQVYIPKVKGQKAPLTIGIHVEQKEDWHVSSIQPRTDVLPSGQEHVSC